MLLTVMPTALWSVRSTERLSAQLAARRDQQLPWPAGMRLLTTLTALWTLSLCELSHEAGRSSDLAMMWAWKSLDPAQPTPASACRD